MYIGKGGGYNKRQQGVVGTMANYSTCDLSKGLSATEIQPVVAIQECGSTVHRACSFARAHTHNLYVHWKPDFQILGNQFFFF